MNYYEHPISLVALTKAITLESKIELFRDLLYEGYELGDLRYGIPDCNVMVQLSCTPQSWSRYRPLIIQYCKYDDLIKTEVRDGIKVETINIRMKYDKKNKQWYGRYNPLNLIDENQHGVYRIMTSEELEKYGIHWYADDKFLY